MSRNPFSSTLMVWKALFLKDALSRFFGSRGAWAWLVIEPATHIAFMAAVFTFIRKRHVSGVEIAPWLMVGMVAFFLFRRTSVQGLHAIDCNKAFFAFRQVRPFDATFSKSVVEAFSLFFIGMFLVICFAFMGFNFIPTDILKILFALLGLWLLGIGYGLISSFCMRIVPDSGFILQVLMMPLMMISGVIFPISIIPQPYRAYILYNPIVHGIESVRVGFWATYHTEDVNLWYLYTWVLVFLVVGMALYRVYETRLVTQ